MHREIEELERRRFEAMLKSDVTELAALLDDDLVYTHLFGDRDTKEGYLEKVRGKLFEYIELRRDVLKEI
jgi:hypothetical protein